MSRENAQNDRLWYDASAHLDPRSSTVLRPFEPRIIDGTTLSLRGMVRDVIIGRGPPYNMSTLPNGRLNLYRIVRDVKLTKSNIDDLKLLFPTRVPDDADEYVFATTLLLDRNYDNKAPPSSWKGKFASALDVLLPVYSRFQISEWNQESEEGMAKIRAELGPEELERLSDEIETTFDIGVDRVQRGLDQYREDWPILGNAHSEFDFKRR